MSTPTPARPAAVDAAALVPQPRPPVESPVEPPLDATNGRRPGNRQVADEEPPGVFGRHAWLIPAVGVVSVFVVFVAMIVLTWVAGGVTPFNR